MGLDPSKHLGKEMSVLQPYLHKLKEYVMSSFFLFCILYSYILILKSNRNVIGRNNHPLLQYPNTEISLLCRYYLLDSSLSIFQKLVS